METLAASPASPGAQVTEIHHYPLRPEGFEEPLFQSKASRMEIMEHFLESDWLFRASELPAHTDSSQRAPGEPVSVEGSPEI